jgi:hypothetical protein
MNSRIFEALERESKRWPDSQGGAASEEEVREAENIVGARLPEDYRGLLLRCGSAMVGGHSILGVRKAPLAADEPPCFHEQTIAFRRQLPGEFRSMVVIEVDGAGNPIGFIPPDRTVFVFDHDFGGRHDLALSFEEYLEKILFP